MRGSSVTFFELTLKTIVVHTLTYFIMGLAAFNLFNYASMFARPALSFMRPTSDALVALGPALQPIRGLLFALAFYPLREILFGRKNGWLITWLLLVSLGIFSTFAAATGSVEGLIYTKLSLADHFSGGILEVLGQAGLLSAGLFYWVNHPEKRWLNWLLGILFALAILMSLLGFFMAK